MEQIIGIWNYFVKSNAFNFTVMVLIFVWLDKKVNFRQIIENMRTRIVEKIEKSKVEKIEAEEELKSAEKSVKNLDSDIQKSLQEAQEQAEILADKIVSESKIKVKQIEANINRVINSEERAIFSRLTSKTISDSINVATDKIVALLEKNPELHEKFINESIESLDRLKY